VKSTVVGSSPMLSKILAVVKANAYLRWGRGIYWVPHDLV
jgi:hypothetical protein